MKKTKSLLALLLALMMVLTMGSSAFAATTAYTITINNAAAGHTYEAYQIFAGDLAIDGNDKVLSNITWGTGVDQTKSVDNKTLSQIFEGKTAGAIAEEVADANDAAAFAKEVAPYLNTHTDSAAQTDSKYTISGLAPGYYLVKDKDNTLSDADDFYTAYIMEVVGDVTANPKGDKPSIDKQIKHNESNDWGKVGDNQIGDTVEFRTISTISDTTEYDSYIYKITDTMSAGLTSNVKQASDVTIKVNDEGDALSADYYTLAVDGTNSNKFTLTIDVKKAITDGKMKKGDSLYTYYTGVVNKDAQVYDEGKQDNTAYLEYSNNPNGEGTGKTTEVKVYDWTFKMGVNKVNNNNEALTGAKFALSKNGKLKFEDMQCDDNGVPTVTTDLIGLVKVSDGIYRIATAADADDTAVTIVYTMDAGSPVIKGLDDSTDYYLYETIAPAGYNRLADPVKFNITAAYNEDGSALAQDNPTVKVGTADASTTLSTNVVNQKGSILPSTGGMGTTIFYIIGSILIIGAAILLITKKRMKKIEE